MPAREFYLIVREEVEGPFTLEEIHHQIAIGRIAPNFLCAEHGSTEWKPVAALLDDLEEMLHT